MHRDVIYPLLALYPRWLPLNYDTVLEISELSCYCLYRNDIYQKVHCSIYLHKTYLQ